jgi:hypothetical protein
MLGQALQFCFIIDGEARYKAVFLIHQTMRILFVIFSFAPLLLLTGAKTLVHLNFVVNQEQIARELCVEREVESSCCKGNCVLKSRLEAIEDPSENAPKTNQLTVPELLVFFPSTATLHNIAPVETAAAIETPRSFGTTSSGFFFPEPHPPSI